MCNLAEGIWEQGIERGEMIGKISVIRRMLMKGMDYEDMVDILDEDVEVVSRIVDRFNEDPTITDKEIVDELFI